MYLFYWDHFGFSLFLIFCLENIKKYIWEINFFFSFFNIHLFCFLLFGLWFKHKHKHCDQCCILCNMPVRVALENTLTPSHVSGINLFFFVSVFFSEYYCCVVFNNHVWFIHVLGANSRRNSFQSCTLLTVGQVLSSFSLFFYSFMLCFNLQQNG